MLQFRLARPRQNELRLVCPQLLMEIIEDRHVKGSTIFTSQVPVNKWHEVIGEQTIADAILDRIIHDAHRVELRGEPMRKKRVILTDELTGKEN